MTLKFSLSLPRWAVPIVVSLMTSLQGPLRRHINGWYMEPVLLDVGDFEVLLELAQLIGQPVVVDQQLLDHGVR